MRCACHSTEQDPTTQTLLTPVLPSTSHPLPQPRLWQCFSNLPTPHQAEQIAYSLNTLWNKTEVDRKKNSIFYFKNLYVPGSSSLHSGDFFCKCKAHHQQEHPKSHQKSHTTWKGNQCTTTGHAPVRCSPGS